MGSVRRDPQPGAQRIAHSVRNARTDDHPRLHSPLNRLRAQAKFHHFKNTSPH